MFYANIILALFQFTAIFQHRIQPISPSLRLLTILFDTQVSILAPAIHTFVAHVVDANLDSLRSGFTSGSQALTELTRHLPVPGTDMVIYDVLSHSLQPFDFFRGSVLYPQSHQSEHAASIPAFAHFGFAPEFVWFDAPAQCSIVEVPLALLEVCPTDERNPIDIRVATPVPDVIIPALKAPAQCSIVEVPLALLEVCPTDERSSIDVYVQPLILDVVIPGPKAPAQCSIMEVPLALLEVCPTDERNPTDIRVTTPVPDITPAPKVTLKETPVVAPVAPAQRKLIPSFLQRFNFGAVLRAVLRFFMRDIILAVSCCLVIAFAIWWPFIIPVQGEVNEKPLKVELKQFAAVAEELLRLFPEIPPPSSALTFSNVFELTRWYELKVEVNQLAAEAEEFLRLSPEPAFTLSNAFELTGWYELMVEVDQLAAEAEEILRLFPEVPPPSSALTLSNHAFKLTGWYAPATMIYPYSPSFTLLDVAPLYRAPVKVIDWARLIKAASSPAPSPPSVTKRPQLLIEYRAPLMIEAAP